MATVTASERRRVAAPIRREANAKINLFLRVLGQREDGYHELESLLVPISLADRVSVRPAEELRVEVKGAAGLTGKVPVGGLNLALVGALALADVCPNAGGAHVEIDKRIPVAAGLGGGSADAAATLQALNELWGCRADAATLEEIGERIGSDVPAMLWGRPVLMAGRGERLAPADVATFDWALVRFGFGVRSPDAYRWWDEDGGVPGPDPEPLLVAAVSGEPELLGPLLFNDLEAHVVARHAGIGQVKERLLEAGALGAVMSGSGSSVLGLARDRSHAAQLASGFGDAIAVVGPPAAVG
jgi:4-diphosphocytidyl-2-C-methyl-D-erythritol kinase